MGKIKMNLGELNLKVAIGIIGLSLVAGACASKGTLDSASADLPAGIVLVRGVQLNDQDTEASLAIAANEDVRYNVFKLSDPERVIVDLIDAVPSENLNRSISGSALVQEVQVEQIEDSLSQITRFEILLAQSSNYLAGIEGNELVVRLIPSIGAMDANAQSDEQEASFEQAVSDDRLAEEEPLALPDLDGFDLPPLPDEMMEEGLGESAEAAATIAEESIPEIAPLPAPVPVLPLEEEGETSQEAIEEEVPAVAEIPVPVMEVPAQEPAPLSEPEALAVSEAPPVVPVPVVEESAEENAPVALDEKTRVIVEPEAPPVAQIETQEIPTTDFTEGTSLLSGIRGKVYTGRRVSLEFQDADIQDVIRLIADVSKLNIILSDQVKGTLTLKLIDVPWDQALDIILTTTGLDKVQHGNILRVAPIESLKKEREIAIANDKAAKQLEPLRLKLFNVNYATGDEMKERVTPLLSERGTVDVDARTNTLIVEDIAENLSRVENLIKVLDTQTPQVRIESRIVQANDRFTRSVGVQWGPTLQLDEGNGQALDAQFPRTINIGTAPNGETAFTAPGGAALTEFAVDAIANNEVTGGSLGFRLGSINETFNLDLRLSYAENEQLARVVSRPSVTVLDNKTARIIQGSRIPFLSSGSEGTNVQFQEAGIEISVTPQITNDGAVILQVSTKSNEPGSENVGGNPIINIREATTELLIKSGRTAVLGGVFRTAETKGEGGVPVLMDIPVLGWAFKGRSRSDLREEMLIFVTPYILADAREAQTAPSSASDAAPF